MILTAALILDAILGEPKWLWDRFPHPAAVMGRIIKHADTALNAGPARRAKGVLFLLCATLICAIIGRLIELIDPIGLLETLVAAILIAQRSLADHVMDVARALSSSLAQGRHSVAKIVGRDTADMSESDVARAAIESAAENLSDGVVAPVMWFALLGLPGIIAYKFVNTADSMIGYRTPEHAEFGWAAAKTDDILNWIPARITGGLIAILCASKTSWETMRRDAILHRSPNAGFPEAAMAGALGVALAGPRVYHGQRSTDPFVFAEGRRDPGSADIIRAVSVLWRVWAAILALSAATLLI